MKPIRCGYEGWEQMMGHADKIFLRWRQRKVAFVERGVVLLVTRDEILLDFGRHD